MHQAMILCNGVQTQVVTEGRWIEEDSSSNNKNVVLIIPGNPGIPEFYKEFITSVHSKLPSDTPVWIMGHAGHVLPPHNLAITDTNSASSREQASKDHRFDLQGQIQHKAEFIKKYIPEDGKIHLIGHSIGCWMILNLLKDESINKRIVKCYMLFPTIERMAESRNGRFYVNVISKIVTLIVFLAWMFSFFPEMIQNFLIQTVGLFIGVPGKSTKAVGQLLKPSALKKVLTLAVEEMNVVKELDDQEISKNANKLWFYYGSRDGWTPVSYYHDLVAKHPNINAELCKRNFRHSFVLKSGKEMGYIIGDMINESIAKQS